MVALTTQYLGLTLCSPLVASASPLTGDPAMWEAIERAGAGAVVLPSLFEEQIERQAFAVEEILEQGTNSFGEAMSYLPELDAYDNGAVSHLTLVEMARERLSIPVIASVNGVSPGGWVR
jgi:dihydroorotate dehydrogenase (fumarate)